jgi:hypothetical protein
MFKTVQAHIWSGSNLFDDCRESQISMNTITMAKIKNYTTLEKEVIYINGMSELEQSFYLQITNYYQQNPSHPDFSNYWRAEGQRVVWIDCSRKEIVRSSIFKVCQDLDARLAIKEGHLRP